MKLSAAWAVVRDVATVLLGIGIALNEEFGVKEPREAMLYFAGALLGIPPVRSGIELILGKGIRKQEDDTRESLSPLE